MPSRLGIEGNEAADEWAKMVDEGEMEVVVRYYLPETSSAHMTRMATEARAKGIARWSTENVGPRRKHEPPKEARKLRKELRHEPKALAGRRYQLPRDTPQSGAIYATRSRSSRQTSARGAERTKDSPGTPSLSDARCGNLKAGTYGKMSGRFAGRDTQGPNGPLAVQWRTARKGGVVLPSRPER